MGVVLCHSWGHEHHLIARELSFDSAVDPSMLFRSGVEEHGLSAVRFLAFCLDPGLLVGPVVSFSLLVTASLYEEGCLSSSWNISCLLRLSGMRRAGVSLALLANTYPG